MDETDATIAARRETYRIVSWVILAINLLLLVVIGLVLPGAIAAFRLVFYDMGRALPTATQVLMDLTTPMIHAGVGLILLVLTVKEVFAPPKLRFWLNVVNLLALLLWEAFCVAALFLPMLSTIHAMQGL